MLLIRKGPAIRIRRTHFDATVKAGDEVVVTETEAQQFLREDPEGWQLLIIEQPHNMPTQDPDLDPDDDEEID